MYCMKCGQELPEGSAFCPSCGAAVTEPGQMSKEGGSYSQESAKQPSQVSVILKRFWPNVVASIKAPGKAVREMKEKDDMVYSLIMIGVNAFLMLLVMMIVMLRLRHGLLRYNYWKVRNVPIAGPMFIGFFASAAFYFAQGGILFGMQKAFAKSAAPKFFYVMRLIGVKAFYDSMALVLVGLFAIASLPLALVIFEIAHAFTLLLFIVTCCKCLPTEEMKSVTSLFLMQLGGSIVSAAAAFLVLATNVGTALSWYF